MKAPILMTAVATMALTAISLAGVAHADTPAAKPKSACFFTRDWNNWHAPNKDTIYLRVGVRDFYKVELNFGSQMLTWPDSHLINEVRGTDSVCGPIDLDLKVAEDGVVEPLFIKSITRLTPEEVAAIPKKDLP